MIAGIAARHRDAVPAEAAGPRASAAAALALGRVHALAVKLSENEALLAQAVHRQRELAGRTSELVSTLARPHHRLATWFGDLIEPFPRLRAAVRAPFDARRGVPRARIGAIVHVYYDELWPELAAALRNAGALDEIYVSIRADAHTSLEARSPRTSRTPRCGACPTAGATCGPSSRRSRWPGATRIEIVCKIHGKRSPHVPTGEAWRRDMMDKLLGSGATVQRVLAAFHDDPSLGILGPGGHVVPSILPLGAQRRHGHRSSPRAWAWT